MGIIIKGVAINKPLLNIISGGAIGMATKAAKKCLKNTGLHPSKIGMMIFSGLYREDHLGEPAVSALIQKNIGANLLYDSKRNHSPYLSGTFSFDLNNGGCGILTGIEVMTRFIQSNRVQYGLITSADSVPFRGLARNYNFAPAGAAILISRSQDQRGFTSFRSFHYPEYMDQCRSFSAMGQINGGEARNILSVHIDEDYVKSCITCVEQSVREFLDELNMRLEDIDLIISSQSPGNFTRLLNLQPGFKGKMVEIENIKDKEYHSAGMAIALDETWKNNRFMHAKNVLFLTVGSGISTMVALYRN